MKQTYNFAPEAKGSALGKVAVVGSLLVVGAFADGDPAWYTDLTTQMTSIAGYVVAVLTAVIGIRLAPISWKYIRDVLFRG